MAVRSAMESEKGAVMVSSTLVALYAAAGQDPPGLVPARQQMAFSLGWHIVVACFGVAFPAMIYVVHRRGITRDDPVALGLARQWATVSAILFTLGAVSATVLGFEMGLLWPGLTGRYGDVLGLPLAFGGLSFFVEAIFLGIYLYGWGRVRPRRHLAMLIPMGAVGAVGMFGVVGVTAWMDNPTGFRIVDGAVTEVNPWRAMFHEGVYPQFAHMWMGAFMVVGFVVAGVYAAGLLRGGHDGHHRLGFTVPFVFATVATLPQPFLGHVLEMRVRDTQPSKTLEFEPTASVPGRDAVAAEARPPVDTTHLAFQTMVATGVLLAVLVLVFWLLRWRGRDLSTNRWFLRAAVVAGPLAVLALECGRITTEVGRQPWIVWQLLRTRDAVSTGSGLWWSYTGVLLVYIGMTAAAIVVLRSMTRRRRAGSETVAAPCEPGPAPDDQDQLVHSGGEG